MMPDDDSLRVDATQSAAAAAELQRRMSASSASGYATPPASRRGSLYGDDAAAAAPASRRSSVYENAASLESSDDHTQPPVSRRSSIITMNALDEQPPAPDATRKRTERLYGGMFSMDQIFSRDLRITGVSKKGSSWRYHIEVLDLRGSLMPFTDSFMSTSNTANSTANLTTNGSISSAANSPASSSIASLSSLSFTTDSRAPSTLPPVVRYSVMRRYNDFRQLYLYLLDAYPADVLETLPKFPDGGLFSYFRGDDPKLLQYRKDQLQRFLRALDENEDTKWSRAFRYFLNPEIEELTTLGGSFAASVEAAPSSVSSSSWAGMGLSRINTESGYVSLSYVKSPEIRFKKEVLDGRGDWKRRKLVRANREEDADDDMQADGKKRAKRLDMAPERDQSDTGDEEEDDSGDEESRKPYTELMKLLSLEPPVDK